MARITILLGLVVLLALCVNIITSYQYDYHSRYEKWKTSYKSQFTTELRKAREKRKENDFKDFSEEEKDAIEVVNLYTQESQIYKTVNKQHREDRDRIDQIWIDYAALLNDAIDILSKYGCRNFKKLYRGIDIRALPPDIPGTTQFKGFTSTSTSAKTAVQFGIRHDCPRDGCQVLLVLHHAEGLYVKKYSDNPKEDEVIMKLNSKFKFLSDKVFYRNNTNGRTKIDQDCKSLGIDIRVQILAQGLPASKRRRRAIKKFCLSDGYVFQPSYINVVGFLVISSYTSF